MTRGLKSVNLITERNKALLNAIKAKGQEIRDDTKTGWVADGTEIAIP